MGTWVPRRTARIAILGAVLFGAAAAWVNLAAAAAGSAAWPTAGLILMSGLMVGVCWVAASRRPPLVPAAIVGVAAGLVVADLGSTLRYDAMMGPFGYANASAAFMVQAIIGALMLMAATHTGIVRVGGAIACAFFMLAVIATRSWTAAVMLPVVVIAALLVQRTHGSRAAVMVCGALFGTVLVLTIALGAVGPGTGPSPLDRAVRATISEQRVVLWGEALALAAEDPLLGVGPGRFASTSPTASRDDDLRWAHHEFLQAGAESGLLGYLFAVGVFVWGFASLWLRSPSRLGWLAAAGLALLGIHASVDYVLHFPAVALIGAAVLGAGLGTPRDEPIATPRTVEPVSAHGWA